MSLDFPLRPDPSSSSQLTQKDVFPPTVRAKVEAVVLVFALVLTGLLASFIDDTLQRIVGALLAAAIVIAWMAWLMTDARTLAEAIRTHGPFDPDHRPNLRLPIMRCVQAPIFAAFVLLFTYGEQLVPVVAVLIFFSYVTNGIAGSIAQYAMLPNDSVEATLQRNAASISFLITTAIFSGVSAIGLVLADGILQSGEYNVVKATLVAVTPMAVSLATYGIVFLVLKRRLA